MNRNCGSILSTISQTACTFQTSLFPDTCIFVNARATDLQQVPFVALLPLSARNQSIDRPFNEFTDKNHKHEAYCETCDMWKPQK